EARQELEAALQALAPKHVGGAMERYKAATARCHALERALAESLGQEYAVPLEWPYLWEAGAPMAHVVSSGLGLRLLYFIAEPDPAWDGSYVNVIDTSAPHELARVRFESSIIDKFGGPNDEVLAGHPLYHKGLEPYRAHVIKNSSWVAEQQAINSV